MQVQSRSERWSAQQTQRGGHSARQRPAPAAACGRTAAPDAQRPRQSATACSWDTGVPDPPVHRNALQTASRRPLQSGALTQTKLWPPHLHQHIQLPMANNQGHTVLAETEAMWLFQVAASFLNLSAGGYMFPSSSLSFEDAHEVQTCC